MSSDAIARDVSGDIEFWRSFGLKERMIALENTCSDIRNAKGARVAGRRHLNDLTKSFRTKTALEQQACITELLKAYQEEIDQLSRRSKHAESELFALYKDLVDAPDPAILLTSIQTLSTVRDNTAAEIESLRAELKQNDEEFSALKNQDVTIRRLEEELNEIRLVQEEAVESLVNQRVFDAMRDIADQQQLAERRISSTMDALHAAQEQESRAQAQLLEVQARADVRVSELESESAQHNDCRERMQAHIANLEQELSILRVFPTSVSQEPVNGQITLTYDGGSQVESELVLVLRQQLHERETANNELQEKISAAAKEFQIHLAAAKKTTEEAQEALARAPTVDDMQEARRKARLLQRIIFNTEEEELKDEDDDTFLTNIGIDALVLERLRTLESELSRSRSRIQELTASEQLFRSAAADAEVRASNALALVSRLESNLEFHGCGNGANSYAQRNASSIANSSMISLQNLVGVEFSSALSLDISMNSLSDKVSARQGVSSLLEFPPAAWSFV
jgi:homeobox protein cut-like